jgi:hypothetical protein
MVCRQIALGLQFVRSTRHEVSKEPENGFRFVNGVDQAPAKDFADGMQLVFEQCGDSEISAATADRPKQELPQSGLRPAVDAVKGGDDERQRLRGIEANGWEHYISAYRVANAT